MKTFTVHRTVRQTTLAGADSDATAMVVLQVLSDDHVCVETISVPATSRQVASDVLKSFVPGTKIKLTVEVDE